MSTYKKSKQLFSLYITNNTNRKYNQCCEDLISSLIQPLLNACRAICVIWPMTAGAYRSESINPVLAVAVFFMTLRSVTDRLEWQSSSWRCRVTLHLVTDHLAWHSSSKHCRMTLGSVVDFLNGSLPLELLDVRSLRDHLEWQPSSGCCRTLGPVIDDPEWQSSYRQYIDNRLWKQPRPYLKYPLSRDMILITDIFMPFRFVLSFTTSS